MLARERRRRRRGGWGGGVVDVRVDAAFSGSVHSAVKLHWKPLHVGQSYVVQPRRSSGLASAAYVILISCGLVDGRPLMYFVLILLCLGLCACVRAWVRFSPYVNHLTDCCLGCARMD